MLKFIKKIHKRARSSGKSQEGMTLIEILVSIVLVGGLIVLFAAVQNVIVGTRQMKFENIAYHIANKQMEDIRAIDFASLPASSTFSDSQMSSLPSGAGSFTISDYPSYSGMKEITVTVTWVDRGSQSITISTLAGSGGINP